MFGYFIYYIIALLIYATYQPLDAPLMAPFTVFLLFIALTATFALLTRAVFSRIESQIGKASAQALDHRFQGALTQQSILAVAVYAINIYELNLGYFLRDFSLLRAIPTLEALVFLLLFIAYMTIIWSLAHGAHHKIYRTGLTRLQYVFSNISFSIPILLPWLVISISADFIRILPFEGPRAFLDSTGGQISYFFFFLVFIAVMGPALIQKFWGCTPLQAGPARARIAALCDMAGMKYRDIMLWPLFGGNMITAGVMGLIRRFRYILVTPALLRHLHPVELDAVIAHEIGHIKKKHLLFYLFFFAAYLILTFSVLDLMLYGLIYLEASYGLLPENGGSGATLISISAGLLMIVTFLVYFRFIFGWFMRNFERQADAYALQFMGFARPLISTFEKIAETSGQAPDRPNWHHYSIAERIDFLKTAEADPSAVVSHDRRIKKGILIFLAGVMISGWLGYSLHFGKTGDTINASFAGAIIEHRLKSEPDNPGLLHFLGDIHYQAQEYKKAETAYRRALNLDPDHVRALNNLAWLYVTCPDIRMRRPDQALDLALRAGALSSESHVLDTLAEAYYANGDFKNAVIAGEKALDAAGENYTYYRDQLEKFQSAARK
jgi:Zn-dependent protease with chaperone function